NDKASAACVALNVVVAPASRAAAVRASCCSAVARETAPTRAIAASKSAPVRSVTPASCMSFRVNTVMAFAAVTPRAVWKAPPARPAPRSSFSTSPLAVRTPRTVRSASRTSSTMTCPSAVIAMSRASGLVEVEALGGVERLLLRLLRLPDDGAGLADDEGAGERLGEGRRPLCRGELGEGAEEGVLARLGPGDQPLPHRLLHPRAHPCRRGERAGAGVLHQAPLDSRLLPHRLRHVHTGGDVDFGTEGVEDGEARVGRS